MEKSLRNVEKRRGRPARSGENGAAGVQAVERAMRVLEVLAQAKDGVALTKVAAATLLYPATAHRMLATLEGIGYVRQDPASGRYLPGSRLFQMAKQALDQSFQFRVLAKPYLQELVDRTGETANLMVLDGDEAAYLDQIPCNRLVRAATDPHLRSPLYCSGVGKCLLAFRPPEEAEEIVARLRFQPSTERTITDPEALRRELEWVRARRFAIDNEEMEMGTRCIAAPVLISGRAVAAMSITGPITRITDAQIRPLSAIVMDVAARLGAAAAERFPELDHLS